MRILLNQITIFVIKLAFCGGLTAQSAPVAAGSSHSSGSGSITYSIGQVSAAVATSNSHSMIVGMQQPYEISSLVSIIEILNIDVFIYPNPFYGDHFTIYSDLPQRYKVYDLAGKMVGQGDLNTGENEIYIPMLSQGMYIMKVGNLSKKIIKL